MPTSAEPLWPLTVSARRSKGQTRAYMQYLRPMLLFYSARPFRWRGIQAKIQPCPLAHPGFRSVARTES